MHRIRSCQLAKIKMWDKILSKFMWKFGTKNIGYKELIGVNSSEFRVQCAMAYQLLYIIIMAIEMKLL